MELMGVYLVGCILLVCAGAIKTLRPDDTARALAPLVPARLTSYIQFRQMRVIIRLVAVFEAGLAGASWVAEATPSFSQVIGGAIGTRP
jgi:hypothetical protein